MKLTDQEVITIVQANTPVDLKPVPHETHGIRGLDKAWKLYYDKNTDCFLQIHSRYRKCILFSGQRAIKTVRKENHIAFTCAEAGKGNVNGAALRFSVNKVENDISFEATDGFFDEPEVFTWWAKNMPGIFVSQTSSYQCYTYIGEFSLHGDRGLTIDSSGVVAKFDQPVDQVILEAFKKIQTNTILPERRFFTIAPRYRERIWNKWLANRRNPVQKYTFEDFTAFCDIFKRQDARNLCWEQEEICKADALFR